MMMMMIIIYTNLASLTRHSVCYLSELSRCDIISARFCHIYSKVAVQDILKKEKQTKTGKRKRFHRLDNDATRANAFQCTSKSIIKGNLTYIF